MAGKKKEVVEEVQVETPEVKNSPAAVKFLKVVEEYTKRNPKKAEAKKAEFEEKLEALNK